MDSNQLRAARALLDMSQSDLAERAGLSVPTIKRAEGSGKLSVSQDALKAIRSALEAAGVIFVDANGEGLGVRLRKS